MKKDELKAWRKKDKKALHEQHIRLLREQFNLRMQSIDGSTVKTHRFKQVRRDIARLLTLLNEKGNSV